MVWRGLGSVSLETQVPYGFSTENYRCISLMDIKDTVRNDAKHHRFEVLRSPRV